MSFELKFVLLPFSFYFQHFCFCFAFIRRFHIFVDFLGKQNEHSTFGCSSKNFEIAPLAQLKLHAFLSVEKPKTAQKKGEYLQMCVLLLL